MRHPNYAECRAVIDRRQCARIAMREDRVAIFDQRCALFGHLPIDRHVFISQLLRGIDQGLTHIVR